MAQYDHRNLANTVHAIPRRRLPCEVGHAIAPQYPGAKRTWVWYHRWIAWPVGTRRKDGVQSEQLARCVNCGKSRLEILDPPIGERRPRPPKREPNYASDGWLRAAVESGN